MVHLEAAGIKAFNVKDDVGEPVRANIDDLEEGRTCVLSQKVSTVIRFTSAKLQASARQVSTARSIRPSSRRARSEDRIS